MNLTPQWLAVSSGPRSRIHLVVVYLVGTSTAVWQSRVHCFPRTTFTISVTRSAVSIYRTEMDWIGYSEGVWFWVGSAWFGSVHLLLMSLQSTADGTLFGKSRGVGPGLWALPSCVEQWNRRGCLGLLEARVRVRNVCRVERSRPQCSAVGRVEAARRCQVSGKTQTCIQGFQPPPAVCVRSAYRRA